MNISEQDYLTPLDMTEEPTAIELLTDIGHLKGYVTFDDLLEQLPEIETDNQLLEEVIAILVQEEIPYVDEMDPTDDFTAETELEFDQVSLSGEDKLLDQVDTDDLVTLYFRQAASEPLLTKDEEVELAKQIELGQSARDELATMRVDPDRREALLQLTRQGETARQRLILCNSRLVISVAKKYRGRGIPFIDLVQEGNIGLMRAIKKFDYRRGNKFSTYATWWIRQAITRAIADNGRTIRVPVHMGDMINKLLRVEHQLVQQYGRKPTEAELAAVLEKPPTKVKDMRKIALQPVSLETPIRFEESATLGDFIEDRKTPSPDETVTATLMSEDLEAALKGLTLREARVLQLRYGLLDGKTYTLQQIGEKMGITRERVRQMEEKGLRKLRKSGLRAVLQEYLG